jgi:O-antigen/teichoic acid export membrane protein
MKLIDRLRGTVPQGELVRGALALVLCTGGAQLIVILSSPILTRLYSPSTYRVFSVAASILSVLITVTCLRYESAIPRPEWVVAAANLALSLLSAVRMSLCAGLVLWLAGGALLALRCVCAKSICLAGLHSGS